MDAPVNPPLHHLPTSLQDLAVDIVPPDGISSRDPARLQPFSISHLAQLQSFACVTAHGGKQLQQLSNLQQLTSLSPNWVQDWYSVFVAPSDPNAACWVGPNLQQLQKLSLIFCPDGDAVAHGLPRSLASTLTSLQMTMCNLSDGAVPALVTLTALKSLDLAENVDILKLPAAFARLTGLTHLSLARTLIGDESLVPLQSLQQLERLVLEECPCTKQGLQDLQIKLPRLSKSSRECFWDEESKLEESEGVEDVSMQCPHHCNGPSSDTASDIQ